MRKSAQESQEAGASSKVRLSAVLDFKTGAFNRSATLPSDITQASGNTGREGASRSIAADSSCFGGWDPCAGSRRLGLGRHTCVQRVTVATGAPGNSPDWSPVNVTDRMHNR